MDKHPPAILLRGWYGQGNLGDDLLAWSLASSLLDLRNDIVVLPTMGRCHCREISQLDRVSPVSMRSHITPVRATTLLTALLKTDVLALGGGAQIDVSCGEAGLKSLYSLVHLAKLLGKRVWLLHIGVDGNLSRDCLPLLQGVLRQSDLVSVRDVRSRDLLVEVCNDESRVLLGFDPAIYMLRKLLSSKAVSRAARIPSQNMTIGVALAGNEPCSRSLAKLLAGIIVDACRDKLITPRAFVFRAASDLLVAQELLEHVQKIGSRATAGFSRVVYEGDIESFCQLFSQCDLVIAHRLHATILSFIMGIPVITVSKATHSVGVASELYDPRYVLVDYDVLRRPDRLWEVLRESVTYGKSSIMPRLSLESALDRFKGVMERVRAELGKGA